LRDLNAKQKAEVGVRDKRKCQNLMRGEGVIAGRWQRGRARNRIQWGRAGGRWGRRCQEEGK